MIDLRHASRPIALILLLILGATSALLAQPMPAQPTPLKGWTYSFDAKPLGDEWGDPNNTKLTDGDKNPSHSVILSGGTIVIDITLPGMTKLTKLVAQVWRHNNNYKLRKVVVEAMQAGQYVPVGENANGFWGPTAQTAFALDVPLDVTTDKLRVKFVAESIVSIQEIELFGAAANAAATTSAGLKLPLNNAPGAHVSEVDANGDGKKEIVLENPLVRLVLQPDGGICRSMIVKPAGAELVGGTDRYGLLRDQLWSPNYAFADRLYFVTTGTDKAGAWAELRTQGVGGMMSFTYITKRISIAPDSPVVRVHYTLRNDQNSQTDFSYGFWVHSFLGVKGQNATYFFPTTEGVVEQRYEAGKPLETWQRDPARGWCAYVGDNGIGLAATMAYKYLNCFYMWAGKGDDTPTLEWRYNRLMLRAGQALETDVQLTPVEGLPRVDGVVGDVIGAIDRDPARPTMARIALYRPPATKPADAVVQVRSLPDGKWREIGRITLTGNHTSLTADTSGVGAGPCLVRCNISRGDTSGFFERPLTSAEAKIAYRLEPLEPRVGETSEASVAGATERGHELSTAVETPHVKWAKPYYKGPISALVLCDDSYAREVIELWQRLDLNFEYVKFRTMYETEWLYQGDRSILSLEAAQKRLQEKLKKNYDTIILAGLKWDHHFTPQLRQAITDKVKAGCGLVYIEPDGLKTGDELAGPCGVADSAKRTLWWWGSWQSPATHYITSGLPWETLPKTRRMPYVTQPQGEVLATIKGDTETPLIVASTLGQGRVLALTYDALTHDPGYRGYASLTPSITYRGAFGQPDQMTKVTWQYWEHWWALLARCAVWSANKDSGIQFRSLAGNVRAGALTGTLTGDLPVNATVDVVFRDRYSVEVGRAKATPAPAAEGASLQVPLPATLRSGRCFADLVLRDLGGASVAWASVAFEGPTGPAIKEARVENKTVIDTEALWSREQPWYQAFRAKQPLQATCKVDLVLPQTEPTTVTATLADTHDRVVFTQTQAATPEATTLTFVASPPVLYNMGYTWRFALRSGAKLWDTAQAELVVIPPREWNRFTFTSWGAMFLWKCEYLWEDLSRRVEDLGLDVAMNGGSEVESGTVWRDYWHNVSLSYLGILEYMGKGVPDFRDAKFADNAAAYAKTKDKKYLVREPSLQDPEYLQKMSDAIRNAKWAPIAQFGRAYDYCMGDEMSLTYYTQYFDYDFSPPSLAAFRKWLQGRYKSLDDLNATWETQFADWDNVMPMPLDEVKARPNAAPWGEFRTFMNETMASYCALIQRTIREKDPEARCGLSGTQEPKPGNGMDWWLMSQGFSYFHSYNTGWSDEMRRSFGPYTGVAASPYRSGYFQAGAGLERQVFWCLLHDTKGISAWTTPLFFNSDFSLSESGADQRKFIHEMKAGIWDAIRSAQRKHDGIAIHYSQASINGALLLNKDEQITKVRDAWVTLIEDLGLQYNFVSYAQVESGLLNKPRNDNERYKVLILPESISLSAREVAEIRQFVQDGGTVIGDQCIGLMDERCKKQPKGLLDDVFGIARSGEDKPLSLGVSVTGLKDEIRLPVAEAGVRAAGAQARGNVADADVPALLTNTFGKGRAAYLNLNLSEFQNERTFATPTERALRQAMLDILAASGVKPRYPITLQSGKAPHIETIRYAAGPLEYLGLLCQGNGKDDIATVTLGGERHAYDARTGQYLGKTSKLTVPVSAAGDCRVYCLSSAPLGKIAATVTVGRGLVPRPQAPEDAPSLRYKLSLAPGNAGERQVVRLAVIRPDGTEEADYARNVILGGEPVEGAVQLAVNDPPGKWTLRARSLCTGQVATATGQVGK